MADEGKGEDSEGAEEAADGAVERHPVARERVLRCVFAGAAVDRDFGIDLDRVGEVDVVLQGEVDPARTCSAGDVRAEIVVGRGLYRAVVRAIVAVGRRHKVTHWRD